MQSWDQGKKKEQVSDVHEKYIADYDITWLCKGIHKHVCIMILAVVIIDNKYFAFWHVGFFSITTF